MPNKRIKKTKSIGSQADSVSFIGEETISYELSFTIFDLDPNNGPIFNSNEAEDMGMFANFITNIQITNIKGNDDNGIIEDAAVYPEANLLVNRNSDTLITYTLVDDEGLFPGKSELDGSIVSTDNVNDSNIEVLSFTLIPAVADKEIDLDLTVNSSSYIIEENLFYSLGFGLLGTDGSDNLSGDMSDDIIFGLQGEDTLNGKAGNDTLSGDAGEDEILGQNGNDLLQGKEGNDRLFGGNGQDIISGDGGDDFVEGGNKNDLVFGGTGNDRLFGTPGDDQLIGDEENDLINGDDGNDDISGGVGNDTLNGKNNDDLIEGNSGDDLLIARLGNEGIVGGADADTFELGDPSDSVFATIVDFDRSQGDKFQVRGSQSDYTLGSGNVSGDNALDTIIEYQGETIAIVEDIVTVDLNTGLVF